MGRLKAALYMKSRGIVVEDIPIPRLKKDDVLVKVRYCGICGTDLHNYAFGIPISGTVLGHEWCGTITELGKDVQKFLEGDRVMIYKNSKKKPPLRVNPRAIYSKPFRNGAFAEYISVPISRIKKVPDEFSDKKAATLEPLVAAIHAVRLGKIRASDSIAFIGAGPIGLMMIQRVMQLGVRSIYVTEPVSVRAMKAEALGVDQVFNPCKEDVVSEIVKLTGGKGPDLVFECAGTKITLNQACKLVARNGRIVCLAVYQTPIVLKPLDWYMMQPEIKFTTNADSSTLDWETGLEVIRKNKIDVEGLISDVVQLNEIDETFRLLLNSRKNTMIRVLVEPNK
jgi:2-desacetyl-2-hydroxyethyl bacteriochlorophyllide A dehydrogenase